MKKIILLLLLVTQFGYAQVSDILKNQFKNYIDATNNLNAEIAYELTYPLIFQKITVNDLKDMYKNFNQNPNFSIHTSATSTPQIYEEIFEIDSSKFVKIITENKVIMTFKSPIQDFKSMISDFKTNMAAKSVTFDSKSNSFTIVHDITVIGIQDHLTKGKWNFINYSPRKNVIKEIFGEKISKQLKL